MNTTEWQCSNDGLVVLGQLGGGQEVYFDIDGNQYNEPVDVIVCESLYYARNVLAEVKNKYGDYVKFRILRVDFGYKLNELEGL